MAISLSSILHSFKDIREHRVGSRAVPEYTLPSGGYVFLPTCSLFNGEKYALTNECKNKFVIKNESGKIQKTRKCLSGSDLYDGRR